MPRVINMRKEWLSPDGVRVDRMSQWGNPHRICQHTTRSQAIDQYRRDLTSGRLPFTCDDVRRELKGKDLGCWCAPEPCHADVLLEFANK